MTYPDARDDYNQPYVKGPPLAASPRISPAPLRVGPYMDGEDDYDQPAPPMEGGR